MAAFRLLATSTIAALCLTGAPAASQERSESPGKSAYGPMFSRSIPRERAERASASDFVEAFRVPGGGEVRVLVKVPAPAEPAKVMRV